MPCLDSVFEIRKDFSFALSGFYLILSVYSQILAVLPFTSYVNKTRIKDYEKYNVVAFVIMACTVFYK